MSGKTTYTPEKEQAALDYIETGYIGMGHVVPVGMASAINVVESTVYKWAADGHGTFSETLAKCKQAQHIELLNKGLTGDFNATITKLALANHGYSEKTSTDVTSGGEKIQNTWNIHPVSKPE